jgi:Cu+-exporting ATPase
MSSVSVVTNALRLRGFRRPKDAEEILHPSVQSRVAEYAYLAAIALVALGVGVAALVWARPEHAMAAPSGGHAASTTKDTRNEVMQQAVSASEAGVRAELVAPPTIQVGVPAQLAYRLSDARSGEPITDVVVGH